MTRRIEDLRWAERMAEGPFSGRPRARGAKARGLAFERALVRALPPAEHGVWWRFKDRNGPGWCQTDLVLVGRRAVLVLEAKYTCTEEAWVQLEGLYLPVVAAALGREVLGIQVCRVLVPGVQHVVGDLIQATALARGGKRAVLAWDGKTRLWPLGADAGHLPPPSLATTAHAA